MRNNQDRLGAQPGGETPPVSQPTQQTKQPLQFVTPTEFVELPSKGAFYPQGHPLHNVDTIEIRHMTAKDEDILTSRALLQKGIAIDRFLQNVIVDKNVNIADLLVGDKNFNGCMESFFLFEEDCDFVMEHVVIFTET